MANDLLNAVGAQYLHDKARINRTKVGAHADHQEYDHIVISEVYDAKSAALASAA